MNTGPLKSYAIQARKTFIQAVTDRAAQLGITKDSIAPVQASSGSDKGVVVIAGAPFPAGVIRARELVVAAIERDGFRAVIEQVAYTWFNRFVALRYMEIHGYLDHGLRVLSDPNGGAVPEVVARLRDLELPTLDKSKAIELAMAGNQDEALYRLILLAQCQHLTKSMPWLFDTRLHDGVDLLLPDHLLATDSLVNGLAKAIPEQDWKQGVEIIGWLYQFFISERKDEVIGAVVKSEDIPAATQLFTPNWIVKYMVQNSLGAQWLATYPQSPLKGQMEYYIEPAEQTDEVNAQLAAITPSQLNPEELTLMDPASGSGHILVEAYELFKAIYLERGYRQRDVPQLILEKNLFGLDIDERAAQLTGFALMMKGRADDQRLFERGVKLNVMALVDSTGFDTEWLTKGVKLADYGLKPEDLIDLKQLFEHATTFGSLIQVPDGLAGKLPALKQLSEVTSQDLFVSDALKRLGSLVQQAELLAAQYDAVVANPPYMGSKFHISLLKKLLNEHFKGWDKDIFAAFILRMLELTKDSGHSGVMTSFVWMFLSSFEQMRESIISRNTIDSLVQLHYDAFTDAKAHVCTFVLRKAHLADYVASFIRLAEFPGVDRQGPKTLEAIGNRQCEWFFETRQRTFEKIPGSPVAYWLSDAVGRVYDDATSLGELVEARQGLATADNDRFLRLWTEVSLGRFGGHVSSREEAKQGGMKWFPYNKGGFFRKWYGNQEFVINWEGDGRELLAMRPKSVIRSPDKYFQESLSWSKITSSVFSLRYFPPGFLFDVAGCSMFGNDLKPVLGCMNSVVMSQAISSIFPTVNFEVGQVSGFPFISPVAERRRLDDLVEQLLRSARRDWNAYERSWDFQSLPILTASTDPTPTLESSYAAWIAQNRDTISEMKRLEEENNRIFIDTYGLADELTPDVPIEQITLTVNPAYRYSGKLTEDELWTRFRQDTMKEMVSYAIGCMMGRYSLDAPGLIYAHSGNESFDPTRYATFPADADGIIPLTDEFWFKDDATERFAEFVSKAWPADGLEVNLAFVANALGAKTNELSRDAIRRYLADDFYKNHCQVYKKRPIYWVFSSGKYQAFECLVYLHRYNADTLGRMRADYVIPLQGKLQGRQTSLTEEVARAGSTAQRKQAQKALDLIDKKIRELATFDDQLRSYADQRIEIDLDDGVKVNIRKFGTLIDLKPLGNLDSEE